MADIIEIFLKKAALVGSIIDEKKDYKCALSILRKLLAIIRNNPDEGERFELMFVDIFEDKKYSELVLQYCMHVLKFQSVREHAEKRLRNDRFMMDVRARRTLEAYASDWILKGIFELD